MKRGQFEVAIAAALLIAGCVGVNKQTGSTGMAGSPPAGGGGTGGHNPSTGNGGSPPGGGAGAPGPQTGVCTNLQCRQNSCTMGPCTQTACPGGGTSSVSGTVYDPAGMVPLYNVVVYVPNEPLPALSQGASCETCNGNFSGRPIAVTLSDAAGHFKLDDVPVGANVPIVIQIGKWRRQLTVPNVANCADTPITDKNQTRLPRNKSEGDIPQIAIATGGSDALECLLRKIGVDDAEFTNDSGTGRVHLYQGYRASPTIASGASLRTVDQMWGSVTNMMRYDMTLMACEGESGESEGRTAAEYQVVRSYADMGGRVFGSHYHTNWVRTEDGEPNAGYPMVARFSSGEGTLPVDFMSTVDDSFPKGMAFRDWLVNVGASTTPGKLVINGSKHLVDATVPGVSQRWLYGNNPDKNNNPAIQYFTFTTPVGQTECGRMIFSDVHTSGGGGTSAAVPFPTRCTTGALTPQEKALEFMLFDISSCVQKDDKPVLPPIIVH